MAIETYWITRWRDKNIWRNSTWMGDMSTEAEARAQLAHDMGYFYSDIHIQLVKITEEVMEDHWGNQSRSKPHG